MSSRLLSSCSSRFALYFFALSFFPIVLAKDFGKWYPSFGYWEQQQWYYCVAKFDKSSDATYCADVTDCILSKLREDFKAMIGGVGVFLGFTPTLLMLMGPSATDIALLSIQRPLLSTLCFCGTAGFCFERPFLLYDIQADFHKALENASEARDERSIYQMMTNSRVVCRVISLLEYVLAVGAVINTVHNSYQVGLRAVISFSCHNSGILPLTWNLFSYAIGFAGLILVRWTFWSLSVGKLDVAEGTGRGLGNWFVTEWTLCIERPALFYKPDKGPNIPKTISRVGLTWGINILLVAQFAMGTMLMSSIIFVRMQDAALIVLRYLASAIVVRLIVTFEGGGMKYASDNVSSRGNGYLMTGQNAP